MLGNSVGGTVSVGYHDGNDEGLGLGAGDSVGLAVGFVGSAGGSVRFGFPIVGEIVELSSVGDMAGSAVKSANVGLLVGASRISRLAVGNSVDISSGGLVRSRSFADVKVNVDPPVGDTVGSTVGLYVGVSVAGIFF